MESEMVIAEYAHPAQRWYVRIASGKFTGKKGFMYEDPQKLSAFETAIVHDDENRMAYKVFAYRVKLD
jgi:hypothetical protein